MFETSTSEGRRRIRGLFLVIAAILPAGCGDSAAEVTTSDAVVATTSTTVAQTVAPSTTSATSGPAPWGEEHPAAGTYQTVEFVPSFTFTVGDGWVPITPFLPETEDIIDLTNTPEASLTFIVISEASPTELLADIASLDGVEIGEESSTEVGGIEGSMVEVTTSADAMIANLPNDIQWVMFPGYRYRMQILEVGGRTVTILVEGTEESFEAFLADADPVIDSVVWGE